MMPSSVNTTPGAAASNSAPALGIIFNDFSPRSASSVVGYRHEAAKYGYSYSEEKQAKAQSPVAAPRE